MILLYIIIGVLLSVATLWWLVKSISLAAWKAGVKHGVRNYDALDGSNVIKHFDKKHFKAVTIRGLKFTYCPVGNICSWSKGDYDNEYCHFCKEFFSDLFQ